MYNTKGPTEHARMDAEGLKAGSYVRSSFWNTYPTTGRTLLYISGKLFNNLKKNLGFVCGFSWAGGGGGQNGKTCVLLFFINNGSPIH